MDDVFAAAMDDLFTDPNIAADAVYTPAAGGVGVSVRVILRRPDQISTFDEARIVSSTMVIQARISEVINPVEGDQFLINGSTCVVQGEPVADTLRMIWTIELRPT